MTNTLQALTDFMIGSISLERALCEAQEAGDMKLTWQLHGLFKRSHDLINELSVIRQANLERR